ncbi:MAG: hypothetical protein ACYC35_03740 [Pirellulales bacterium]
MSIATRLEYLYLAYLSRPACHRPIYRRMLRCRVRRILDLGMGTGSRALRMIQWARRYSLPSEIEYTGIDLFEGRGPSDMPGLTLKDAHRMLKPTAARVRLVPGDPLSAMARVANEIRNVELVVVSADQDADSLAKAWLYLPRVLAPDAQVLVEEVRVVGGSIGLRELPPEELAAKAAPSPRRKAA